MQIKNTGRGKDLKYPFSYKDRRHYEMKLKKWLDNPVETERTNALEEHDMEV